MKINQRTAIGNGGSYPDTVLLIHIMKCLIN